jgi:hypothetical protein
MDKLSDTAQEFMMTACGITRQLYLATKTISPSGFSSKIIK